MNSLKTIVEVIDLQARMQMKSQANKLVLSYLWWFLEPLLFVILFYFVFALVLKRGGGGDFVVFLLVGKVVFMWFSKAAVMGSTSLRKNKGIIILRDIPRWIFPLVNVQVATYKSLIALFVVVLVLLLTGYSDLAYLWQIVPLLFLSYFFISSVACFLSFLVALAEDFSQIISLFMIGMMFCSGIFWDINAISNLQLKNAILIFNPLAGLIDAYRTAIVSGSLIQPTKLYSAFVIGFLMWSINVFIFTRYGNSITRRVVT